MNPSAKRTDPQLFRAMIFDMDGVIVDSHPIHREAWQRFLQSLGREVSDEELEYILDGRKREDILRHFLGPLSSQQILEYGQCKDLLFRESAAEIQPIRGLVPFIEHLAGQHVPMAVATSASESRTRFTLEQLRLRRYFDVIITGKDVRSGKPAPDIYQAACRHLSVEPEEAVAFEDAVAGIEAAKAAGLRCVGVLTHQPVSRLVAAGADLIIRDFTGASVDTLEAQLPLPSARRAGRVPAFSSSEGTSVGRG